MHEMSERNIGNSIPFTKKCRHLNTAHQRAVQGGRRERGGEMKGEKAMQGA